MFLSIMFILNAMCSFSRNHILNHLKDAHMSKRNQASSEKVDFSTQSYFNITIWNPTLGFCFISATLCPGFEKLKFPQQIEAKPNINLGL